MDNLGELSLVTVTTSTLAEGIKFLYAQATELLKRKRERADQKVGEQSLLAAESPSGVLDGNLDASLADEDRIADHARELSDWRHRLVDYVDEVTAVSADDPELRQAVHALRGLLELVYGQRITFVGEQRPKTGTVLRAQDLGPGNIPGNIVTASGPGAIAIGRDNTGSIETHVSGS